MAGTDFLGATNSSRSSTRASAIKLDILKSTLPDSIFEIWL
ncbi:hypothetical protein VCHC55C2_0697 [Vibrio cholerae HC-55C2]|nr:hypothetical protein VCHC50A1_0691 [Vibrio cholerae HC-50A1]EKG58000.1 hypothetical protein VCHC52A1_0696 [Vibrio cholerae HC-52A1]EKG63707.1 hypothetical protein VCHC56A1_0782 [Vibrio cholerae HC-56A1]EKG66100.1 hypothetical protein VCHC57A1_3649 [Vibrio cholerae HC-57A1]EKL08643.1 hypothetical protein VCHC55C2_0697 [Vibrio cholerae HC-55C2]EKL15397.1 hypothetical protein VCHC60A1_0687 [Vibrio cholerae HC-60A1]EKL16392.1 hypothetical protein VCHC59A1_0739 [Vibrio cholerae HC-59A1]EKL9393